MPYLTLGDYADIPVTTSSPRMREEAIGGVRRAFSGVPRSSVRAYYRVWEVETTWIPLADAETMIEAMKDPAPLTVSGDMLSATSALVVNIQRIETTTAVVGGTATEMMRLSFELGEIA